MMKGSKEDYPGTGPPPPYAEPYLPGTVPQHPAPPLQPQYQPIYMNPQSKAFSKLNVITIIVFLVKLIMYVV